jgi:hypothetical protein
MAQCITCGTELHPERAVKYDYCTAPACQEKNAKGLTMVAVGMNKAADELIILDERTREALANGKYQDQRRGSFGPPAPAPGPAHAALPAAAPDSARAPAPATASTPATTLAPTTASTPATASESARGNAPAAAAGRPARRHPPQPSRPAPASATGPRWTASQERLALLYNQQGLRPDEIADKLGVSTYLATQIVLAARSQRKA